MLSGNLASSVRGKKVKDPLLNPAMAEAPASDILLSNAPATNMPTASQLLATDPLTEVKRKQGQMMNRFTSI